MADSNQQQQTRPSSEEEVISPNVIQRSEKELEAASQSEKPPKHDKETHGTSDDVEAASQSEKSPKHDKETHGTSDDIDEQTPVDEVKGPSVIQRMKEEIEAFLETAIPKKDSD